MIKVKVKQAESRIYKSISVKGHAESGPYGHDLVCAAVSAIVTGGANAINDKERFNITLEEGNAKIELKKGEFTTIHDDRVLEVVYIQLLTIEKSYGQFIKIEKSIER